MWVVKGLVGALEPRLRPRPLHWLWLWLWLLGILHILSLHTQTALGADLAIEIPGNLGQEGSSYRLDYQPARGRPPPNSTFFSKDIVGDVIQFSQGLPGTKYEFWLYYSNATVNDILTWSASITTAPDPPSNLTVVTRGGKQALVSWSPPLQGYHSGYKLRLVSLSDLVAPLRNLPVEDDTLQYVVKDLQPGATYQVQAYTVFEGKESVAYTSTNFTTKPNTPGKFIVWFRNETTLLVLWQPPYPAGTYSHYKVSIDPPDALDSVLYVEKEGEPPGPAQAAFKELVPGRAYNISVQTMSEEEISAPTTAQYRTVPLRPLNVTVDKASITSSSFKIMWDPPKRQSEFDKYQVSIASLRRLQPVMRNRDDGQAWWEFKENLEAGKTYQVIVKTLSGKVTSWPMTGDVTLKPLPVHSLKSHVNEDSNLEVVWTPSNISTQDSYKVNYHEVETFTGDSNTVVTENPQIILESLLPGRNYSISVQAVSNKMESNETSMYVTTRPSSPIIEDLRSIPNGLNISWKYDVNSKQDKYEVWYRRNDTGHVEKVSTMDTRLVIRNLFPGAVYEVKVIALSHDLPSEPHEYFQAVLPHPPTNMSIERVSSNSVLVHWTGPDLAESIVKEYAIRYRTESDAQWVRLPSVSASSTEAEVTDMTPGEKYTIQVNTVSAGVESLHPQQVNHTVRPNPVSNIAPLVDSTNITLEWPRREGRVETYVVSWWNTDPSESLFRHTKNITNARPSTSTIPENEIKPIRVLVGDLMPGVEYNFEIYTISYNLESEKTKLTTRTLPLIQSEVVVVNDHHERDSVTLRYTPTPPSSSRFDLYRFSLSEPEISVIEKLANDSDKKVTFKGLIPGKLYNITVWTVSDGVSSQPIQRQDRLYPEPITMLNATHISDTEITLKWDTPRGEWNAFEIQYLSTESNLVQNLTSNEFITLSNLKPHRNYTFTVVVRSGTESSILRSSLPISASFTTLESVPGQVENFHPNDIQPSEITFTWALPTTEQNGIIRKFIITYGLEGSIHTLTKEFKPWENKGTLKNLIPGKTYIFRIQGETKVGYGQEAILKQKMPISAPPKPRAQVVPTEVCRTTSTIQIRFRKNYFSSQNGNITMFTIIVAEDDSKNASGLEMPSWRDVQAYSVWPPYQVMEPYFPFNNSSVEDFTIGSDQTCDVRHVGYCNGPLKSGSVYKVKVRAFTAPDKFTDTAYSFSIQTDTDNTPIIVGITVPIILLALLVVLIVVLRRRRAAGRKTKEARNGNDTISIPDSVIETSRPVRISEFAEHYRIMSADSDFRFSEEFEELKHVGREQACTAADLPCNRPKNRFTNILPYDHSRFKLQPVDDEEGSDYINANYVPGYNSPREFIVTQGPLHSTRDDFWRMCWESNSRAIVMLTRCIEKGREKCDHYWPFDTRPVYYGDISVTILNDSHYQDWSVTEFMICRGETQRVMRHFHFTTWPDFGVPNPPQTLVRFVRAFRERIGPDQRPIVVHCSAGVGRSGTFITLDRIIQQIAGMAEYVDIFGIVYNMRKERVWMVQTEQQYICIHQCLLAVLEGQELKHNNQSPPPHQIHHNQAFEDDEGIAESGM
ncbi:protein tyrosine phosphatase 10D isoform X2 [Arctopsyche grandis]|uniref:protein tyrosine phosphatase 10D isoform X2 n=1 Tax=Arctopsyche grandis TaxID=121162 RepID=UPI00406D865A